MHLIKNDILHAATLTISAFARLHNIPIGEILDWPRWQRLLPAEAAAEYTHVLNFAVAETITQDAQTFIFDREQILAFLAAVDRRLPPGDYSAPFPQMIVQFSAGIDERLFTTGIKTDGTAYDYDEILGLVIALPESDEGRIANIVAWYKSTAVNCVQLPISGDGTISYDATGPHDAATLEAMRADRQRIANLALLCLAYIHSPGIAIEHVEPDPTVNRKRIAKGKRTLPDYYICYARRPQRAGQAESVSSGRHVSFRFDVAGHFRRLTDGRTIWIRPHQRGLDHELYKPKVYKIGDREMEL